LSAHAASGTTPLVDLALASCAAPPEPDVDEPVLCAALARAGIRAQVLAWDDPAAPFAEARLTVLRSTWNYPHRPDDFLRWAEALGPRLLNPLAVVRWNTHKSYLDELARGGLPVVPTRFVARGARASLARVLAEQGWPTVVVKPAISAGSLHTRRIARDELGAHQAWLEAMVAERDMMVQPYLDSVEGYGERAIVTIDGHTTHAVRKAPRFAGGEEHVSEAVPLAPDERRFAQAALALAEARFPEPRLLYARVDVARNARGELVLMELELVEPSLFLLQCPAALERFVGAIGERLR
jgi:glutathione synthase/RimK-type ligase-like ATP-grasp enzyme